jgi:hypothetical protein
MGLLFSIILVILVLLVETHMLFGVLALVSCFVSIFISMILDSEREVNHGRSKKNV